jgi:hypothetical protein
MECEHCGSYSNFLWNCSRCKKRICPDCEHIWAIVVYCPECNKWEEERLAEYNRQNGIKEGD